MKPLQRPDSIHFHAAQRWLELDEPAEANLELAKITPSLQANPEVLAARWEAYAGSGKWDEALAIATAMIELEPEAPLGWTYRTYALNELNHTADARDNLLGVVDKFSADPTIRYDLACCECLLGRNEQAMDWLQQAFQLGNTRQMKLVALADTDLKPLWSAIDEI